MKRSLRNSFLSLATLIILTFALASAQTNDGITNPDSVFPDETVGLNSCTTGWTNGFYKKYAKLESSFGAYDSWPSYAKEELLPFFSVSSIEQLDDILADKYGYGRIDMVTLYSVIVGDYNAIPLFWDEKTRLQYSDLLLKYNLANGGWIDVIRPDDIITPDEAIRRSQDYIVSIGLASQDEIVQFDYFWSYGRVAEQKTACYEINVFSNGDELLKTCYVFPDLTVSENNETVSVSEETWIDKEVIEIMQDYVSCHEDIPSNASFAGWPLYAKEHFSLYIAPIIRQNSYGREDVYSPVDLLAAAQYDYGIPDERSISVEIAREAAYQELIHNYHLEPKAIKEMDVCIYYDITDELNPAWKFLFSFQNYQMETDRNTIYKIHISAYNATIEFSDSWNYRNDSHSWESLMLRY